MKQLEKICINCPAGCRLKITIPESGEILVQGNRCPRGAAYAKQEMTDPRRTVTAVVRTDSADRPCIPVKTGVPVPMKLIPGLLKELAEMRLPAPPEPGTLLLETFDGFPVRVITTGD